MANPDVTFVAKSFMEHLPVYQVLVPFVSAPLCVLFGNRQFAWYLTFLACFISFIVSILLLNQVAEFGTISYALGGWPPPIGIEYRIDFLNAFLLVLVSGMALLTSVYLKGTIDLEVERSNQTLFLTCLLLCVSGLLGVLITGDAFNLFVFLEISSLSTYVLVAQGANKDRRALTASFDYLIMGTIGATFFVIGLGFLYAATGTLNMYDIAGRIQGDLPDRTIQVAFAFILVGLGLKGALFPLHTWLPKAYSFSPTPAAIFLASTATKVAIYAIVRFLFSVFFSHPTMLETVLVNVVMPLGILAMFVAGGIAFYQRDLKRMLAFSSVSQIGYILVGVSFMSSKGLTAAIIHLFNHGITKGLLFMCAGVIFLRYKASFYKEMSGLGRIMPWTSAAFLIGGLSLIGIPGTAGFISKWILVQAALEQGSWLIALAILLSSLIAVLYVWQVTEIMYFGDSSKKGFEISVGPFSYITIWILAVATIFFGLSTSFTLEYSSEAARVLLNEFSLTD